MPARKTLGTNFGQGGGMLSAMGLASAPRSPDAEVPPPRPSPRAQAEGRSAPLSPPEPASPLVESQAPTVEPTCRVATDISAGVLHLAKRAAYWNRETLRNFLERAIQAEARRIAEEQGLDLLPAAPPLRRGRPFQP